MNNNIRTHRAVSVPSERSIKVRLIVGAVMVVVALMSFGLGGASAYASSTSGSSAISKASLSASNVTTTVEDRVCLKARKRTHIEGKCVAEQLQGVSAARPITSAELKKYGNLKSANGVTVAEASRAGIVYIRGWYQEQRGLYYVNWKERHEGKFLFNGSTAWVDNAYGYVGGYHNCGLGYGFGYDVEVKVCAAYNQQTYTVDNYDAYRVHVVFRGIPIYVTHSMHAYTRGNGTVG